MLTEHTYISLFDIRANGEISVRKTTEIRRNGAPTGSTTHYRVILAPNDPRAAEELGDEPFYLAMAQQAWSSLSQE